MKRTGGFFVAIVLLFFYRVALAQEARPTESLLQEAPLTSKISPEESEGRLKDAKILFDRGKTDAAIYMLQQLEKADPSNYKVLFKLGEMAIADRNWAYSITVLRKASFIRPKDIEVRLILIDIYKAYQMPIQGIIVAKEILTLDPQHLIGTKRLAELHKEQAMLEDEIKTRQRLRRLEPDDYENLKRLASIYYESGDFWAAAKIYEDVRKFYPKKNKDLTRLAAIYDKLGESFRGMEVLDQLADNGERRSWLKRRAVKNLRQQSEIYDPFFADITYQENESDEFEETFILSKASYTHLSLRSSIDLGILAKLAIENYKGLNDLAGDIDITNGTLILQALKNWQGQNYQLVTSFGVLWDDVSGDLSLSPSGIASGLTLADFPFLKDPTFDTYGGTLPVGGLKFLANPGLHAVYRIVYEHGQVSDLDARLNMIRFDKGSLEYAYQTNDLTEFQFTLDGSLISDNNVRYHSLISANTILWGGAPLRDFRGSRKGFFRNPPFNAVTVGYAFEYFNDKNRSNLYETFSDELRHKGELLGRMIVSRVGSDQYVLFSMAYAYSFGTTLDEQHNAGIRLFYLDVDTGNEFGVSTKYEESLIDDPSQPNQRIVGKSEGYSVSLDVKLRF